MAPDLDHVGIAARDLSALHAAYERLGFRLTPLSQQKGALTAGEPERPWGTANRCAFLGDGGYLELIGIVDPALPVNRLDQFLARYDGMHILVFGTEDAEATAKRLGVPTVRLARQVEGREVAFRLARLGAFPEGRVQFCQHLSRELLWAPPWLDHPNGALALDEVFLEVADPEEAALRYAAILGLAPARQGDALRFTLSRGALTIGPPRGAPVLPFMSGFAVRVASRDRLRRVLDGNSVPYDATDDAVVVAPAHAGGATCIFREGGAFKKS